MGVPLALCKTMLVIMSREKIYILWRIRDFSLHAAHEPVPRTFSQKICLNTHFENGSISINYEMGKIMLSLRMVRESGEATFWKSAVSLTSVLRKTSVYETE